MIIKKAAALAVPKKLKLKKILLKWWISKKLTFSEKIQVFSIPVQKFKIPAWNFTKI